MMYDIIFDVLSAWQVIAVGLLIMIILPVVFYFASFDRNPVKIKRIVDKKRAATGKDSRQARVDNDDNDEEDDDESVDTRNRQGKNGVIDDEEDKTPAPKRGK